MKKKQEGVVALTGWKYQLDVSFIGETPGWGYETLMDDKHVVRVAARVVEAIRQFLRETVGIEVHVPGLQNVARQFAEAKTGQEFDDALNVLFEECDRKPYIWLPCKPMFVVSMAPLKKPGPRRSLFGLGRRDASTS